MPAVSLIRRVSRPASDRPQRYLFLLLDRFTMISFAAAIEPLRLANRLSGKALYEWRLLGDWLFRHLLQRHAAGSGRPGEENQRGDRFWPAAAST